MLTVNGVSARGEDRRETGLRTGRVVDRPRLAPRPLRAVAPRRWRRRRRRDPADRPRRFKSINDSSATRPAIASSRSVGAPAARGRPRRRGQLAASAATSSRSWSRASRARTRRRRRRAADGGGRARSGTDGRGAVPRAAASRSRRPATCQRPAARRRRRQPAAKAPAPGARSCSSPRCRAGPCGAGAPCGGHRARSSARELELAYQPVVDWRAGEIERVETLLRWRTSEGERWRRPTSSRSPRSPA